MSCSTVLEKYLRDSGVPFEVQHHPLAFTAHAVALSERIPQKRMAKVVMIVADDKLSMLVLPTSERVFLPEVAAVLGAREVRLAIEEEFVSVFPDCEVGAMPPFGNLYNVPVYVDSTLGENSSISFQAGTHTDTMSLSYVDYLRIVDPTVVRLSFKQATYTA